MTAIASTHYPTLAPLDCGLLSPFQEQSAKMSNTCSRNSFDSFLPATTRSSFANVKSNFAKLCGAGSSDVQDGLCFCGRAISSSTAEDEDAGIYCSTACARQDAMNALTGSANSGQPCTPVMRYTFDAQAEHGVRKMMRSRHNLNADETDDEEFDSGSLCSSDSSSDSSDGEDEDDRLRKASLALQQSTMMPGATHYRRMGALRAQRDSYPSEVLEEIFSTPMSGNVALDDVVPGESAPVEPQSATQRRVQRHIISLPSTPSLDHDHGDSDEEEAVVGRQRQEAIEHELRELDSHLKKQLQTFDKENDDYLRWQAKARDARSSSCSSSELSLLDEEGDVLMNFTSPQLDYEAPLGWRRGTRVYSNNFLGLQVSPSTPSAHSDSSDRAVQDHVAAQGRIDRLYTALGVNVSPDEKDTGRELTAVNRPSSALDLARRLALAQESADACTYSSVPMSHELFNSSFTSTITDARPVATNYASCTNSTLRPSSSKRALANFFSRRPSAPSSTTPATASSRGISSADLCLTPHRSVKSVSPRFAVLGPPHLRSV